MDPTQLITMFAALTLLVLALGWCVYALHRMVRMLDETQASMLRSLTTLSEAVTKGHKHSREVFDAQLLINDNTGKTLDAQQETIKILSAELDSLVKTDLAEVWRALAKVSNPT